MQLNRKGLTGRRVYYSGMWQLAGGVVLAGYASMEFERQNIQACLSTSSSQRVEIIASGRGVVVWAAGTNRVIGLLYLTSAH